MPARNTQGSLQGEDYSWWLIWTPNSGSRTIETVLRFGGGNGACENENTQGHIYLFIHIA